MTGAAASGPRAPYALPRAPTRARSRSTIGTRRIFRNTASARRTRAIPTSCSAAPAGTYRATIAAPARRHPSGPTPPRAATSSAATCARCRSSGQPSVPTCCTTRPTMCGARPSTHGGGRRGREIAEGVALGAVANSIREDQRLPALLYGATDTQVWVSFDDGDHWQSLRFNMPASSVRDIEVKDDSTCLCADLIAGTHGRGFWILDNLSPLRHLAKLIVPGGVFLVKPQTAIRVRFGTNEPTPWPPELPAGGKPPAGAGLPYFLPPAALGRGIPSVLGAGDKALRRYARDGSRLPPDPPPGS